MRADAAWDSEAHHVLCRESLGIERTIIPAQTRGSRKRLTSRYRAEMKTHFARGAFGRRWPVGSAIAACAS